MYHRAMQPPLDLLTIRLYKFVQMTLASRPPDGAVIWRYKTSMNSRDFLNYRFTAKIYTLLREWVGMKFVFRI